MKKEAWILNAFMRLVLGKLDLLEDKVTNLDDALSELLGNVQTISTDLDAATNDISSELSSIASQLGGISSAPSDDEVAQVRSAAAALSDLDGRIRDFGATLKSRIDDLVPGVGDDESSPVDQSQPVDQSEPVDVSAPVDQSAPVDESAPVGGEGAPPEGQ